MPRGIKPRRDERGKTIPVRPCAYCQKHLTNHESGMCVRHRKPRVNGEPIGPKKKPGICPECKASGVEVSKLRYPSKRALREHRYKVHGVHWSLKRAPVKRVKE